MHDMSERAGRLLAAWAIASVVTLAPLAVASAGPPMGACCQEGGGCAVLNDSQCTDQGGDYLGNGTTCADVACDGLRTAPVLSIFGLVAAIGALGGLGVYRLLFGRRRV